MARVTEKVEPVPLDVVEKTLPHLSPQCRAMVRLQLATGMRPGEVVILRPCDVDTNTEPWEYTPRTHKTEHHGKARGILFGPQARDTLAPWMDRDQQSSCFSPAEAEQARNAERRRQARSPRRSTNRSARPKRPPAGEYTTDSYRRAIVRACEIAFEMPTEIRVISKRLSDAERERRRAEASLWRANHCWTPHRLRHSFGKAIRSKFGIEAAQITLGVADLATAAIYSERDKKIASQDDPGGEPERLVLHRFFDWKAYYRALPLDADLDAVLREHPKWEHRHPMGLVFAKQAEGTLPLRVFRNVEGRHWYVLGDAKPPEGYAEEERTLGWAYSEQREGTRAMWLYAYESGAGGWKAVVTGVRGEHDGKVAGGAKSHGVLCWVFEMPDD